MHTLYKVVIHLSLVMSRHRPPSPSSPDAHSRHSPCLSETYQSRACATAHQHSKMSDLSQIHLLQELVEDGGLSDLEITCLDGPMVDSKDHIDVLHRLRPDVGELLDLAGRVLDLCNVRRGPQSTFLDLLVHLSCSGRAVPPGSSPRSIQLVGGCEDQRHSADSRKTYPMETYRVMPKSEGLRIS
jgi:hypothetical protein